MKTFLVVLVVLHGLIHLLGFTKAYNLAAVSQLTQPISKVQGLFWLVAAVLFVATALLFLLNKDSWSAVAILAALLSQYLIFTAWQDAKFGTLANILILATAVAGYANGRFYKLYRTDVKAGLQQTAALPEAILTEADLQDLPAPVQQYLRYVGAPGKPKVVNFKVEFSGEMRKNEASAWMPFKSEQYNFMADPVRLFYMNATMKYLPVAGYHRFKNGRASMDIRLWSLFKVQYQAGAEMDVSETVTFFNDMCCMAPATLIDKRIQWLETVDNRVKASFTNNGVTISAWLHFNDAGELINFISEDRYAAGDNNTMTRLPWSTPLKDYKSIAGYRLPGYAEAVYRYPEGELVYGTFRVEKIEYNCIK